MVGVVERRDSLDHAYGLLENTVFFQLAVSAEKLDEVGVVRCLR